MTKSDIDVDIDVVQTSSNITMCFTRSGPPEVA